MFDVKRAPFDLLLQLRPVCEVLPSQSLEQFSILSAQLTAANVTKTHEKRSEEMFRIYALFA